MTPGAFSTSRGEITGCKKDKSSGNGDPTNIKGVYGCKKDETNGSTDSTTNVHGTLPFLPVSIRLSGCCTGLVRL